MRVLLECQTIFRDNGHVSPGEARIFGFKYTTCRSPQLERFSDDCQIQMSAFSKKGSSPNCCVENQSGRQQAVSEGLQLTDVVHRYGQKGLYQVGKPYRTVIERPRSMRRSSGVTMPGAGGGVRLRKWCFKPGTRDESTSNHFADNRVKISPFEGMPFCRSAC